MHQAAPSQKTFEESQTPILDRLIPMPMPPKRTVKSVIIGILLGIGLGIIVGIAGFGKAALDSQGKVEPFYPSLVFVTLYVSLFAGTVVHEIGHLVAGVCAGFRVNFLRIGPLQINPPFRLSLQRKSESGFVGLASMLPRKKDRASWRAATMGFGGPCANVLSALAVLMLTRPLTLPGAGFATISLVLGVANLVPFTRKGAVSDGNRIAMVICNNARGRRWLAIQQLLSDWWAGTQPENFDPELLRRATALQDLLPDTAAGYLFAYSAAFYGQRNAEAKTLLETALAHSSCCDRAAREGMLTEAAIFHARRGRRVDLAEQWLSQIPVRTQMPGLRAQAEAAVLEGQNHKPAALAKLEESAAAIAGMPAGAQRDIMLRSVERWKSELMAAPAGVSSAK